MIIKKREQTGPVVIDLKGPEGNAYVLMSYAKRFSEELGLNRVEIQELINEMMDGDYEHLLQVFDREFGSFVILVR